MIKSSKLFHPLYFKNPFVDELTFVSFLAICGVLMIMSMSPVFAEEIFITIPEGTSREGCELTNECYLPNSLSISAGDKIVWQNEDTAFHTVTSGTPEIGSDNQFDSGMFSKGEKFSHEFQKSGIFDYFCLLHPWMEGTIIVEKHTSENNSENGGGCLIATATYGTELAPQVQLLREIRDNIVMSTNSGTIFVTGFNNVYYLFSPTIADLERQNPAFQDFVRLFILPMISSLSVMELAEHGNDFQVVMLGSLVILWNFGLYVMVPVLMGVTIRKKIKIRKQIQNTLLKNH